MLVAAELDMAIGRLVHNSYTEYVPLFAPHVIAGNNIVKPLPGFALYNITDGVVATDVTGWFCRWLTSQHVTFNRTTVKISVLRYQTPKVFSSFMASVLGIQMTLPLLAMAILIGDWFGLVNAAAMLVSVLVRGVVVNQNRVAIDEAATASVGI
ncbi:MAG: hypothetical protein M1835_007061 [Candelina submexicana]|nr:MAG: hypothetical protein M1835_007061 [Candelina submexicana]